jgi:hypothetical protein
MKSKRKVLLACQTAKDDLSAVDQVSGFGPAAGQAFKLLPVRWTTTDGGACPAMHFTFQYIVCQCKEAQRLATVTDGRWSREPAVDHEPGATCVASSLRLYPAIGYCLPGLGP